MARRSDQPDRRDLLLDEALRLVAEGGLQAVTHRSVERAAGVPHGSVTYYFGSRDELVAAMVDRMVATCESRVGVIARDVALALAPAERVLDLDAVAAALAEWMQADRELHLARLELELAAARDPRLRERMSDAARVFWRLCEPLALALGSAEPERDGRVMASMVDGLLIDGLAHDPADPQVLVAAARQLLRSWAPEAEESPSVLPSNA